MKNRNRFDAIDREQLAAQLIAIMDAHFQRPTAGEKLHILEVASRQLLSDQASHQISNGD